MSLFQSLWDTPMCTRGRLSLKTNGSEVSLAGLDHNKVTILAAGELPGLGMVLTLHEEGGQYWVGRGMTPGYAGATTYSVLLDEPGSVPGIGYRYVRLSTPVEVKMSAVDRKRRTQKIVSRLIAATRPS